MQELETENKRDGGGVSTEEKKTILIKEAKTSILKQLKEQEKSKKALKIKYPEIQCETWENMETLKKDLEDVETSIHTYQEIVWGQNALQNWCKEQEATTMPKENILFKSIKEEIKEEMNISDTKVMQKDMKTEENINTTTLDKYTFEEYLSEKLQQKCSKEFEKQDQYVQQIEKKLKNINDKIDFMSEKHEYLRIKFNDIGKIDLKIYGHTHEKSLMKLMKKNPQLREEVYVSYKKQYEEQQKAIKMKNKMLGEGTKLSDPEKCITIQDITNKHLKLKFPAKKYSMQDPEVQKEIEVSYQKQCDENLQATKSLMKMKYEYLLHKMVTKSLQEDMSLEDYRSKCKEEDLEMLNKIPGPFRFRKEFNYRKAIANKIINNLEDLILRYDYLQNDIKHTEDVIKEMRKNIKIECRYKKMSWEKYTMIDPEIHRQVKTSYEKQLQEQEEAKSRARLMLKNPISKEEEKKSCEEILRKDKKKEGTAIKIQKDTESLFEDEISKMFSCSIFPENSEYYESSEKLRKNVKDPQIVKHLLKNDKLQKMYAAVMANNMDSLYKNMLFKHTIRHHNDKYTIKFEEIIEKNIKWCKNYYKELSQILQELLEKLLKIEGKLNKREMDLEKLEKKIKYLEKDISIINVQSSKKNTQEDKILRQTLNMQNVDRTCDPEMRLDAEIEDSYKTQTEDKEHAVQKMQINFLFDRYISMRKELKEIRAIKENNSEEIYFGSSQKTRKLDDNVKPSMTNRVSKLEKEIQYIKSFNIKYIQEIARINFAIHQLQTTMKKYIEFDNIKKQINKHEYEISRMESRTLLKTKKKKIASLQKCCDESQKATVMANCKSPKSAMSPNFTKSLKTPKYIANWSRFVRNRNVKQVENEIRDAIEIKKHDNVFEVDFTGNKIYIHPIYLTLYSHVLKDYNIVKTEMARYKKMNENIKSLKSSKSITNWPARFIRDRNVKQDEKETHDVNSRISRKRKRIPELNGSEEKENFDDICKSNWKSPKSIVDCLRARNAAQHCIVTEENDKYLSIAIEILFNCL